ncbi:MAG: hypothetical protein LAP39_24990 [Acidobacteriia bacterium]|nr:hypothetical protein [Terriglobia bacterium]
MIRSLYRSLLWLHPPAFRRQYGEEMLWIFEETGGAVSLVADGFFSLVRQWIRCPGTMTLAAAGFGGVLHMALFLVMTLPMMSRSPNVVYVRRAIWADGMPDVTTVQFSGNWVGTLRSTGPSGPLELMLAKTGPQWVGKLYIQGPDGAMHSGPLEDIKVQGDSLCFRVQAGDADMSFTGQLRQGKLAGILEATANGNHVAAGPRGKVVGQGTWVMDRARPRSRASGPGQRQA